MIAAPTAADIGQMIAGRSDLIKQRGATATYQAQQEAAARRIQAQQAQAVAEKAAQQKAMQDMQARVAQQQAAQQAAYQKQMAAYNAQMQKMQQQIAAQQKNQQAYLAQQQAARAQQQQSYYSQPTNVAPAHGSARPVVGDNSFQSFLNSIAKQESGGNYGAHNRSSGAMGKYQIMPSNLGGTHSGWDWEALGRDITPAQFMASPQLQEAIAQYKLRQYFNKYGAAGAAMAWYGGPGAVKYSNSAKNAAQGAYPSINGYAASVVRRMGG